MSRKRSQSTSRKELGVFGLILAMVILGIIGWFWKDATGYPYREYGMTWWATAVFVAFTVGMLYYALFVLPIPGNEGWTEGLRLLTRNFTSPPAKADNGGRRRKKVPNPLPQHLQELPPSFVHLGSGIVSSHHALALAKGGGFSRPAGPGFVILFKKESLSQIIDVRKHSRLETVKANTQDGILIEVLIAVSFRVWQDEDDIRPGAIPYRFDSDAIFHVNYAGSVTGQNKDHRWSDIVTPIAANLYITEIGRYTLDELYQWDSNGQGPITEIDRRVKRSLENNDQLMGIEILSVNGVRIILPETVQKQRIKAWQARWHHEILKTKAQGEAEADLRLKRARARAQIDIIENITHSITQSHRRNVNLTEIVALRMIEALEEAVADVSVQALIPQPVLTSMVESSRQMLNWMDEERGGDND